MQSALAIGLLLSLSGCANVYSREPSCGRIGQEWSDGELLAVQRGIDRLCIALPDSCGRYEAWQFRPVRGESGDRGQEGTAFINRGCVEIYLDDMLVRTHEYLSIERLVIHEAMHLAGARSHEAMGMISGGTGVYINTNDLQYLCDEGGYDCSNSYPEVL